MASGLLWGLFHFSWGSAESGKVETKEKKQTLAEVEGFQWIKDALKDYGELLWLTNDTVEKTEENGGSNPASPSLALFKSRYVEFDRTMMTLKCMRFFLQGEYEDYLSLISNQGEASKLRWDDFRKIHCSIDSAIKNYPGFSEKSIRKVIQYALIFGDMGKTQTARDKAWVYNINIADHDAFIEKVLVSHPEILPSYGDLTFEETRLLKKIFTLPHFGWISHIEGGLEVFNSLSSTKILEIDPDAFEIGFFVHMCDVAGALGHVDFNSSIVFNHNTYRTLEAVKDACYTFHRTGARNAYQSYLDTRASWLNIDASSPLNLVVARIAGMLRLYTPEEGVIIRESLLKLDPGILLLVVGLIDPLHQDSFYKTPTYVPAFLVNLLNNKDLGLLPQDRLKQCISIGIPFVAMVFKEHRENIQKGITSSEVQLNFNPIAKIAKENPKSIENSKFKIEKDGHVTIF